MFGRGILLTLIIAVSAASAPSSAFAQRGALLEDLFRTWAKSQLERNQSERERPENRDRERPSVSPIRPSPPSRPIPTRSSADRPGTALSPNGSLGRRTVTVGSSLPTTWNSLYRDLESVSNDLRVGSARQANLRPLVPGAFELAARAEQLQRLAAGQNPGQLAAIYPAFDRDYRQFSFQLRSNPALSSQCRSAIARGDSVVNRLARHYSVSPQWNRERFADVVVMAQAYLQSLMDDLQIVSSQRSQCRHLTHDLEILVSRLEALRPRLPVMSYDQAAAALNQFTSEMVPVSQEIRELRNAHLDLRLDRLRSLADESYALLWMPPPVNQAALVDSAVRIEHAIETLRDQLDSRVLRSLPSESRRAIEDAMRTIDRNAHRLADRMKTAPNDSEIPLWLQQIDIASLDLARRVGFLPGIHHASMATIRDETDHLFAAMRLPRAEAALDYDVLRSAASSLEGFAESLRADLRRYQRYLVPASYRSDVIRAGDALYRAARDFHDAADDRRELDDLFQRRERLLQTWQQLNEQINDLSRHEVPSSGARAILLSRDRLHEPIAIVAAMLGQPVGAR